MQETEVGSRCGHEPHRAGLERKEGRSGPPDGRQIGVQQRKPPHTEQATGGWGGGLGIEADLIRWTDSLMSDRRVRLVQEGREGEEHEVETGVSQGPPIAPILFMAYLSGVFDYVEGIKRRSCSCQVAEETESVRAGDYEVQFNQHATWWLGIWIDSKMTSKSTAPRG